MLQRIRQSPRSLLVALAPLATVACADILGLDAYKEGQGGAAATTSSTETSTATSGSSDSSSSTGQPCTDGTTQTCYSGQASTKDIGLCVGGTQTCAMGSWGECAGEVLPSIESCQSWVNEDCVLGCGELVELTTPGIANDDFFTGIDFVGEELVLRGDAYEAIDFGGGPLETSELTSTSFVVRFDAQGRYRGGSVVDGALGQLVSSEAVYITGIANGPQSIGSTNLTAGEPYLARLPATGGPPDIAVKLPHAAAAIAESSSGFYFLGAGTQVLLCKDEATAITCNPYADVGAGASVGALSAIPGAGVIIGGGFTGVHMFGATQLDGGASGDLFIATYSSGFKAAAKMGINGTIAAASIKFSGASTIFIAGSFAGTLVNPMGQPLTSHGDSDAFVARWLLTTAGTHKLTELWVRGYGGQGSTAATSLSVDPEGRPLIASSVSGTADFGGGTLSSGTALTSVDTDGTHRWSRRLPAAAKAAISPTGKLVVAGSYGLALPGFEGTKAFDGSDMPLKGLEDSFYAVLAAP